MLKKLRNRWPLHFEDFAFTDVVSGKQVNYYRDGAGTRWMATHRFAIFSKVEAVRQ